MRFLIILCALMLSACGVVGDKPEVTACEYEAREILELPQYYKRHSATSWNEPLTGAEMERIRSTVPAIRDGTPGRLIAAVEYEFRTPEGRTYNNTRICQYVTRNGEPIGGDKAMMMEARANVADVLVETYFSHPVAPPK